MSLLTFIESIWWLLLLCILIPTVLIIIYIILDSLFIKFDCLRCRQSLINVESYLINNPIYGFIIYSMYFSAAMLVIVMLIKIIRYAVNGN
jgi:hypothetical protein